MEFCTESSKGENTVPLAWVVHACNGAPTGGVWPDLLRLSFNLERGRKKQTYNSDFTTCKIMVPAFCIKHRLSLSSYFLPVTMYTEYPC